MSDLRRSSVEVQSQLWPAVLRLVIAFSVLGAAFYFKDLVPAAPLQDPPLDFWVVRDDYRKDVQVYSSLCSNLPRVCVTYTYHFDPPVFEFFFNASKTSLGDTKFWATTFFVPEFLLAHSVLPFYRNHYYLVPMYILSWTSSFVWNNYDQGFTASKNAVLMNSAIVVLTWVLFPIIPWFLCDFLFCLSFIAGVMRFVVNVSLVGGIFCCAKLVEKYAENEKKKL